MDLKIIGSGSKGNCYILDDGKEALVIECGMPFVTVKRAVDFDIQRIAGAIITHEHGDHAKHVGKFLEAHIPVYMSSGTAKALNLQNVHGVKAVFDRVMESIGNFRILPFPTHHDAAQPFGYLIHHPAMGTVLFATDTRDLRNPSTRMIRRFERLTHILIECNYWEYLLLSNDGLPREVKDRIRESHCSLEECVSTLQCQDLAGVVDITLIHLSDTNADAERFKTTVQEATGKTVHIAESGITMKFNKSPF